MKGFWCSVHPFLLHYTSGFGGVRATAVSLCPSRRQPRQTQPCWLQELHSCSSLTHRCPIFGTYFSHPNQVRVAQRYLFEELQVIISLCSVPKCDILQQTTSTFSPMSNESSVLEAAGPDRAVTKEAGSDSGVRQVQGKQ